MTHNGKLIRKPDIELRQHFSSIAKIMEKGLNLTSKGYHYRSLYHFALEEFKFYQPEHLTTEERSHVMRAIKNLGFEPESRQCFCNSQLLALNDHTGRIKYAEGQATNIIPTAHGWCEINGKVIDLTWRDDNGELVTGNFPDNRSYAGVVFKTKYFAKLIEKTGESICLLEDWERDFPVLKNKWNKGAGLS